MFSGMGADARVFRRQLESIPQMVVAEWMDPLPGESLASYAARLAEKINPGEPCFVGGASFGGFVALEMINHLDVIGCFLVGSVRSPDEFPGRFKALKKISHAADALPFELATLLSKVALLSGASSSGPHVTELMKQLSESEASFLRWACRAVLEWEGPSTGNTPIHQIHGEKDAVLPARHTSPDKIIPGAGHALSMSHPDEVTGFLKSILPKYTPNTENKPHTESHRNKYMQL